LKARKKRIHSMHLIIILAAVIIIPGIILGILALRAIEREEAYIEKNFTLTLTSEVNSAVTLVDNEMKAVRDELSAVIRFPEERNAALALQKMRQDSSLIGLPFLLSSHRVVVYPPRTKPPSQEESLLEKQNRELFEDTVSIPVYKNIVKEYKDTILNEDVQSTAPNQAPAEAVPQKGDNAPRQSESAKALQEEIETQQAINRFNNSEPLRQKIYKQAREQGQEVLVRNIILPADNSDALNKQWSYFILESHTFSQIIGKASRGIIPRFIEDKLYLLYWKKNTRDSVVGCVIDIDALKQRLLQVMPRVFSQTRILVILDEKAKPLVVPEGEEQRQWFTPFAAQEISELLPRWEIAAYLTNPNVIRDKAQSTALVLWILIAFLLVALFLGGVFLTGLLMGQMKLAQQKTNFVANVSHELKTPLTSLRLFAELLRDNRQPDAAKRKQYLETMVSETERLTRLINNVLDFTRMGKGKRNYHPRPCDIGGLCEDIIRAQRARLEHKGFTVKITCPAGPVTARIDEEALKQVMINLLSNAEKYSGNRKSIEVTVSRDTNNVIINILDRGPGIPPRLSEKIFKEFYRVDDSLTAAVSGSGLGLSISRKILRDHGGDIRYLPRSGGGSRFRIFIPKGENEHAKTKDSHY